MMRNEIVFAAPNSRAAKRLTDLQERRADLVARGHQVDRDHHAAGQRAKDTTNHATQLEGRHLAGQASKAELTAAQREAAAASDALTGRDWRHESDVLSRAVKMVEGDIEEHVRGHYDALIAELQPDAHGARDRVQTALAEIEAAHQAWHGQEQRAAVLLSCVPGRDSRELPVLDIPKLRGEAERALNNGIPVPLPRPRAITAIVEEHHSNTAVAPAGVGIQKVA